MSEPVADTEHESLDLARRLLARGRDREAFILLRSRVRHGGSLDARRLLVESARRERNPAEAGRWGASLPGATTPEERDAYARHLRAGPGDFPQRLYEMSHRWPDRDVELPGNMADVLRRIGVERTAATPEPPAERRARRLPRPWWAFPGAVLGAGISGGVLLALMGHLEATGVLRTMSGASALFFSATLCADAVWRRPLTPGGRLSEVTCAVLLAAGGAFLIRASL